MTISVIFHLSSVFWFYKIFQYFHHLIYVWILLVKDIYSPYLQTFFYEQYFILYKTRNNNSHIVNIGIISNIINCNSGIVLNNNVINLQFNHHCICLQLKTTISQIITCDTCLYIVCVYVCICVCVVKTIIDGLTSVMTFKKIASFTVMSIWDLLIESCSSK